MPKIALLYFAIVFGAGFLLGPVRVFWLVPRLGVRVAELIELPVMLAVTVQAARWLVRRYEVPRKLGVRLAIGVLALSLLVAAEIALVLAQGLSVSGYIAGRDPISGIAYLLALGLFAVMPALVHRTPSRAPGLIDRFIDAPDVAENHEVVVRAPADTVFDVATNFDFLSIPLVRAIFRLREVLFGIKPAPRTGSRSLVEETLSIGWGILASRPGRELVVGAVTQPWVGDVKFRPVPPEEFATFAEPNQVKIAWTLEAEPLDAKRTRLRTQTRALATDANARRRFLRYWSWSHYGIVLIRILGNRSIRREAERRAHYA